MPSEPLQPFAPPSAVLAHFNLPASISPGLLVIWICLFVFVIWATYTAVAIYHWLKYSHGSSVAFPAIAAHLAISLLLMSFILSGAIPSL